MSNEVDAVQFGPGDVGVTLAWLNKHDVEYESYHDEHGQYVALDIPAANGLQRISLGDWILSDRKGNISTLVPHRWCAVHNARFVGEPDTGRCDVQELWRVSAELQDDLLDECSPIEALVIPTGRKL